MDLVLMLKEFVPVVRRDDDQGLFKKIQGFQLVDQRFHMVIGKPDLPVVQGEDLLQVFRRQGRIDPVIMDKIHGVQVPCVSGIEQGVIRGRGDIVVMDIKIMNKEEKRFVLIFFKPGEDPAVHFRA